METLIRKMVFIQILVVCL